MPRLPLLAAVLLALPAATLAQPQTEPLVIGETFTLPSDVLGEERRINVYTPAAWGLEADTPLPTLYMPDGGIGEDFLHVAGLVQISVLNGTMRPFRLVGIENTERQRDLTGPTEVEEDREIAPQVGGSAAFRAFLRDELMPAIRAAYPTAPETAIVGESLAGLFVVETALLEPDLFDTAIAIDPSLWWNGERLVDEARDLRAASGGQPATLYLATSAQPEIAAATARLAVALTEPALPRLAVALVPHPEETHGTIYPPAALLAFRQLFAPPTE
ncbi:MAG TPA: alpha/beta hydrolase [Bacteroidetes bacterium]|nr:alpha/beta hydrolase [Bacteroidota bacterium]HIL57596.1 alpha/beta hydrolase [Rhodothermales bacterium]